MSRKREYVEPEYFSEELHQYSDLEPDDLKMAVFALLEHLKLTAVKTNRTKHGDVQVIIQPTEE